MAAVKIFFLRAALAGHRRRVAGRTRKRKAIKKKQSLPAGHRMKIKPWFWKTMEKTMVLTCILKECKLLCVHGFEKTMVFQGHRMKIPWIFRKPWFMSHRSGLTAVNRAHPQLDQVPSVKQILLALLLNHVKEISLMNDVSYLTGSDRIDKII
jgi:hypothetical protein